MIDKNVKELEIEVGAAVLEIVISCCTKKASVALSTGDWQRALACLSIIDQQKRSYEFSANCYEADKRRDEMRVSQGG